MRFLRISPLTSESCLLKLPSELLLAAAFEVYDLAKVHCATYDERDSMNASQQHNQLQQQLKINISQGAAKLSTEQV